MTMTAAELGTYTRPELSSLAPDMPAFLGKLGRFRDIRVNPLDPAHPELGVLVEPKEKRKPLQQESPVPEESLTVLGPDIVAAKAWLDNAFYAIYKNRVLDNVQVDLLVRLGGTDAVFKKIEARYNELNPKPTTSSSPKPGV